MTKRYDTIVIGGGHNGLVCAGYLAKAGSKVLVVEARESFGGLAVSAPASGEVPSPGPLCDASRFSAEIIRDLSLERARDLDQGLQRVTSREVDLALDLGLRECGHEAQRKLEDRDDAQHRQAHEEHERRDGPLDRQVRDPHDDASLGERTR